MSHLGTRLFADRLADDDEGVDAVLETFVDVIHGGDELPDDEITIYSDTRDGWVARGMAPDQADSEIAFPFIRVITLDVQYDSGVPQARGDGTYFITGTLRLVAQPILRDDDTAAATARGMYILRAMRNVVVRWDDPANFDARAFGGIRLYPASTVSQGKPDAPLGDRLVSPGALLLTYPFEETVLLPL